MGEVYRARDTRLEREVAIKVLPESFVEDDERLARFEREAKLLAQLHHPNIASIFAMERWEGRSGEGRGQLPISGEASPGSEAEGKSEAVPSGGVSGVALVMELVEGPTLAERLESGALPVDESLLLARQIAEALEAAHEKGIIHRDLKPQNIKASIEGTVKVLDFGLAKAMDLTAAASGGPSASQLAASPTLTLGATVQGMILGTAAYMAPEQAKGFAVDKRADIWAFGVVLFEMLSGQRLFEAPTVPETLAQVLTREPDLEALPSSTPPPIRRLLRRCLERNPKNRLHDVADARLVLDDVLSGRAVEPGAGTAADAAPAPHRGAHVALAGVLLLAGGIAGWLLRPQAAAPPLPDSRWTLALPDGFTLSTDDRPQLDLSRDGTTQVAVVVGENRVPQLLLRRSDQFEPKLLEGTEDAASPFFSPDGAWIGFFVDDALMKIPAGGGPPVRLATVVSAGRGGTWSSDGFIYFATNFAAPLSRVPANGGEVQPVTQLDPARSERTHRWPQALPGGAAVLFTCDTLASAEYYDDARIEAVLPATGERRILVEGASQARYSAGEAPGGHLVFARGGSLYAQAFDPQTLEVRGTPRPIVQGVSTNVGSGAVQFAISDSGAALWAPGGLAAAYRVVWVDRQGRETPIDLLRGTYNELALSPDGTRIALTGGPGGVADLWVADLERGSLSRLTSGEFARSPIWTPDGTRILYAVLSPGDGERQGKILSRPADGSRPPEVVVPEGKASYPSAVTPDGRGLIFDRFANSGGTESEIYLLPLEGGGEARPLTSGAAAKYGGIVSPDGKWFAYVSTESGRPTVFVRPFPEGDRRWQISSANGDEPRFGRDGRELFYRADSVLYRVPLDTAHGFQVGRPEPLLDRVASGGEVQSYFFSPDGGRILTVRTAEGSGAQRSLYLDLGFSRRLGELASGKR